MKTKLIITSYVVLILLIIGLVLYYNNALGKNKQMSEGLKAQIIEADELQKLDSVTYTKVVNDLLSERQLNTILKTENKELFNKVEQYKILYYGVVNTKEQEQAKDSVPVMEDSQTRTLTLIDYYPSPENPFIEYRAVIDSVVASTKFTIHPFRLDFSIVQDPNEVQRVVFNAPSWLEIDDIQIYAKSPEIERQTPKLYIGAGVLYHQDKAQAFGTLDLQKDKWIYGGMFGHKLIGGSIKFNIW